MKGAEMNVKDSKQNGQLRTAMFYSKSVALLNDIKNVQKARDAKWPTFLEFLEEDLSDTWYFPSIYPVKRWVELKTVLR